MPQIYRTTTVGNDHPVLYQISIRQPGAYFAEFATYTFPLSPSQLRFDRFGASSFSDVQGPSNTDGVTRVVDRYGLTPPLISIEGTTGWDTHLVDGNFLPGLNSMQLLEAFLAKYAQLNQQQREQGSSQSYSLEFYDYFKSQFWAVEPVGPQSVRQVAERPQLCYYRFRWAAYRALSAPLLGTADALLQVFGTPAVQQVVNTASTVGALLAAYSPISALTVSPSSPFSI